MDKQNVTGEGLKDTFCLDGRCAALEIKPSQHNFTEETTAGETQIQNPLNNHLILQQVISYLKNLEDLKNCRLVHSTWADESSKFLKKNSIFKVSKRFLKSSKKDINSLELFQPKNLELFPCQYRCNRVYSKKDWEIVKKLIAKLSDGVEFLKFPKTEVMALGRTQSFTDILRYNFPNLVQLTLGDSKFSWPNSPPPPIPSLKRIDWTIHCYASENSRPAKLVLLEGVFKLAPNLETLKLREEREESGFLSIAPGQANMFLNYLNSHPSSIPNLKDLDLDYLSTLDIVVLSNLKIKLRSLKLRLPVFMINYKIFEDFLKRQNGTLETLRFPFASTIGATRITSFTFPFLPKLKKLKLVHEGPSMQTKIEDVDYAKQFPVLQSLVIKYIRKDDGRRIRIEDRIWLRSSLYQAFLPLYGRDLDKQVCKTLRVLQLSYPHPDKLMRPGDALFGIRERLSIMFPNVHNEDLNIGRARVAEGHPYRTNRTWLLHLVQQSMSPGSGPDQNLANPLKMNKNL